MGVDFWNETSDFLDIFRLFPGHFPDMFGSFPIIFQMFRLGSPQGLLKFAVVQELRNPLMIELQMGAGHIRDVEEDFS